MSNAEVSQCVLDIKSWFSRTKCKRNIKEGATSADLQRLQKALGTEIPRVLRILLQEINGGIYFMDKVLLSSERILEIASGMDGSGIIPFCGDDNSMLVLNTRTDEVLEWEDGNVGDVVSPNLLRYLENYRNDLLGGHFEFLDEIGVVEKMGKSKK